MKIRLIWKFLPVPIFITNWLIPSKFAGYHIATLALVRPEYKEDEGLIQHELTHVKQNIRTLGVSGIRQYFDKNHKLDRECEAYATQLMYVPHNQKDVMRTRFVNFMYTKYDLGMSKNYIRRRFETHLGEGGEG
jgi:hypothetical protein|tara:strand:+ start:576 stop:977 length:402 start_codon:yes stop_codon:yes gene_type:complete